VLVENWRALVAFQRQKRRERSHELRRDAEKPDRKSAQERDGRVWRCGGKRKRGGAQRQRRHDQPTPFEHVGERQKRDNPRGEADLVTAGKNPMRSTGTAMLAAMTGSRGWE
jgi:hypothetical protein